MLKGKNIKEIYALIKWALRLDLRAADAMEIAMANRVLIEFSAIVIALFLLIQILLFKI